MEDYGLLRLQQSEKFGTYQTMPPMYQPMPTGRGPARCSTPPPPFTWLSSLHRECRETLPGTRTPKDRSHLRSDMDVSLFSMDDICKTLYRREQEDSLAFQVSREPSETTSSAEEDIYCGSKDALPVGPHRTSSKGNPPVCEPCMPTSGAVLDGTLGESLLNVGPAHLSVGSIGHPQSCATACRYVKRHSGCREDVLCQCCHLCFWQRRGVKVAAQAQDASPPQLTKVPSAPPAANNHQANDVPTDSLAPAALDERGSADPVSISVGTRGHPFACSDACKYVRRKTGCRDGVNCTQCHLCQWRRGANCEKEGHPAESLTGAQDIGFGAEACENLQNLIRLQLYCKTRELDESVGLMADSNPISASACPSPEAGYPWQREMNFEKAELAALGALAAESSGPLAAALPSTDLRSWPART
mmetsp:Transcript_76309/g.200197  ORF Transcript_76309/g.200197 Transcript_76309/m.200197 type:complete len:417 (-) Transcript_76309:298-1548(-)